MSAEWLNWMLEGLLATSTALLVVLALRRPMARTFGAGCVPLLWGLVPLAQASVWLPAPARPASDGWQLLPGVAASPASGAAAAATTGLAATDVLLMLWAGGALAAALYFYVLQRRFRARLGMLREQAPGVLIAARSDVGPAVLGLFRPRIVLPADFTDRYTETQQTLILAHERSHLRRGDVLANAIATGLRCLYWFNPLLHYAAERLRHDHELASDADVVAHHPHARRCYADTLLNVQLAVPGLPVGCLWQSSHPLKERILMLSTVRTSPLRRRTGTLLALSLTASLTALAWAGQPGGTSDPSLSPDAGSGPTYRRLSPPKYPQSAIDARQEGHVLLRVRVEADGSAGEVEIERPTHPALDQAAVETVRTWTFNPATRAGSPVSAWVQVPICFSLSEQQDPPACTGGEGALDGIYRMAPKAEQRG